MPAIRGYQIKVTVIKDHNTAKTLNWEDTFDDRFAPRDNPNLGEKPIECLQQRANIKNPKTYSECTQDLDNLKYPDKYYETDPVEQPVNSYYVDSSKILSVDNEFPPAIGIVWVWRDSNNITTTYAKTTRNYFEQALTDLTSVLLD